MFIHFLVFENNSQIGSLMLKLWLSHRADYIVYFPAHSSKWFISKETAIVCENQFGCLKCAKINNIYSKGKDDSEGNDLPQRKDYQIGIVSNCNIKLPICELFSKTRTWINIMLGNRPVYWLLTFGIRMNIGKSAGDWNIWKQSLCKILSDSRCPSRRPLRVGQPLLHPLPHLRQHPDRQLRSWEDYLGETNWTPCTMSFGLGDLPPGFLLSFL